MQEPDLKVSGHVLRYVSAVKENYFGANTSMISSTDFERAGFVNLISKRRLDSYYEEETEGVLHNAFESFLTFAAEGVTLRLPRNLWSNQRQQKIR